MRASAKENQTIVENKTTDTKTHEVFDKEVAWNEGYAIGRKDSEKTENYTVSGTTYDKRALGDYSRANVTVSLLDAAGNVIKTTTSDKNGDYSFAGIAVGSYTLRFSSGQIVKTASINVKANLDFDMGFEAVASLPPVVTPVLTGNITGNTWLDKNGNKLMDDQSALERISVFLMRHDGSSVTAVKTVYTDALGKYKINDLPEGKYSIAFGKKNGTSFISGGDSEVTSSGYKFSFMVKAGVTEVIDAGYSQEAKISGKLFADLNGNGLQDAGEAGKAGLFVYATDNKGYIQGAMTKADGSYEITGLGAGKFQVVFGSNTSLFTLGNKSALLDVQTGSVITDINAGMKQTVSIQGKMFNDLDRDGQQDSGESTLAYKYLSLYDTAGRYVTSIGSNHKGEFTVHNLAAGEYTLRHFSSDGTVMTTSTNVSAFGELNKLDIGLVKLSTLKGSVWKDQDGDSIWDANESGRAGLTVKAVGRDGQVAETTTTDAKGNYVFDELVGDAYRVLVEGLSREKISFNEDVFYKVAGHAKNIGIADVLSDDPSLDKLLGDSPRNTPANSHAESNNSAMAGLNQLAKNVTLNDDVIV